MNLSDLIRRFRVLAGDRQQPYLWENEDVKDWLNDAQQQACIRGRLLREDAKDSVCKIVLDPTKRVYKLHPSVYELINVRIVRDSGQSSRTMRIVTREWLDNEYPNWRDETRDSTYIIQDDRTVRIVGAVYSGEILSIECYRTPLEQMVDQDDEPEVHEAHHEHLIQWALHKAFSVPDADSFDESRSQIAGSAFTAYFGQMPDSDMRRSTRHDVIHHTHPVMP